MERVSVLCMLLLLCSLSGGELQDNDIIEQRKVSPESVNVLEPQPCPSDLHAVLRDMSAKLAVLQTKMEMQQTLNQEQAAKLAKNEIRIQELHNLNQEQATKLKEFEKEVTQHHHNQDTQQQAHTAELRSLKSWANVTENQVESLRRDRAVGQVAFSASLLASGSGTIGPINAHTTLVFRGVISNIGNAYNPNTGFFIAPVRGAYHFEFYVGAGSGSVGTVVVLVKNGEHIFAACEHETNGYGSSANGATLVLEAGDVVFLRLWQSYRIYDNDNDYSTFSGHLLFPM